MTPAVSGPVATVRLILPAAVHLERGGHTRRHDHRICTERRLGDSGQNRGGAGTGRGPHRHHGTSSGGDSLGGVPSAGGQERS